MRSFIIILILTLLQGCAWLNVERRPDGTIIANYGSIMKDLQNIQFGLDKNGVNDYNISLSADESNSSKNVDRLATGLENLAKEMR